MTLYETYKDIMHDLYILAIENYGINECSDENNLWLGDGIYGVAFIQDKKLIGVILPDGITSYRLTEDGSCFKYNCNTEKLRKITYNTFQKHFKNAVLSFGRSIEEENHRLAREYPYLNVPYLPC